MQKQLNRKTHLKRNLTKSKATRPVKQNMNISRAETLNEATKHLGEFTKHLQHTLNGHTLEGTQTDVN